MNDNASLDSDVAVIGMACRVPGADTVAELWQVLIDGRDTLSAPPSDRVAALDAAVRAGVMARAGYLADVAGFDASLFGMSPREARDADPQQRLLLELCWEAFEDAGIVPGPGFGTGVFVGATSADYALLAARVGTPSPHTLTGTNRGILANRLSHYFGFDGPSLVVDTGQSSGLVAVHTACESLRGGESDLAVAGGIHLNLTGDTAEALARLGALSADGRCHTFDAAANGFARGEGGGLVVLKPLARALADGDRVHAVLRGGAVNHDGACDALTVPSAQAQARVLRAAYRRAAVTAEEIGYVELHGTGTPVGDPVEAAALGEVHGGRAEPLPVGSVKTNIGHLEAAAGVIGLIKTVLALGHRVLPASLNFSEPNPAIRFTRARLRVVRECEPWPGSGTGPVLAGVSSFGIGGTNAHLVVQSWPAPQPSRATATGPIVWPLSGHTDAALRAQAGRLAAHLHSAESDSSAAAFAAGGPMEIARSLAARSPLSHRAAVVGRSGAELAEGLRAIAAGTPHSRVVRGKAGQVRGDVVFVFPGQGTQWPGMAAELLRTAPVFAAAVAECDAALAPWVDYSVTEVLRGTGPAMDRSDVIQPALWTTMVALAALWREQGITPAAVVGQSQGEIAAACVAGALSLADGARLSALRGRLVARHLDGGSGMIWVGLPEHTVRERLVPWGDRLAVAVLSGPESVAVAGELDALDELAAAWGPTTRIRRVALDYASHSALVEPVRDELIAALAALRPRPAAIPFHSTVTGGQLTGAELNAEYWYRNLREPVRLHAAVRGLLDAEYGAFVEISPHPVLLAGIRDCALAEDRAVVTVPTLRRGEAGPDRLFVALAELSTGGMPVDWTARYRHVDRIALPHYAFQRQRYWVGEDAEPRAAAPGDDLATVVRYETAAALGFADPAEVDPAVSFQDLGFDSAMLVELATRLDTATSVRLNTTALFAHPTPERLATHLAAAANRGAEGPTPAAEPARPGNETAASDSDDPVVIVGIGCRFPGGIDSPETFWTALAAGADLISTAPVDRGWHADALGNHGGFLTDVAGFDPGFFGISAREATAMDPQQRLLLETSWEALEYAGFDPTGLRGAEVGIFFGATASDYGHRMHETTRETAGYTLTGTSAGVLSGRVAYVLGTEGPAVTVDTACSSSLVALHLAARSLRSGECATALAGGAAVLANPGMFVEFTRQGGLSPDGRCRAFAAAADGTGWAEGAGVLVLQRLSDARAQGREVLAVLRGSAVNSDGASNGLTAPSGPAQQRVIRRALADAGLRACEVDAVEAHGTGTRLGDPIEAEALLAVYGPDRDEPLWLGSVKSNVGHTQAAAGVAGVIKLVLALRHQLLPRTLHAEQPTESVDWSRGAVRLLTEPVPWPPTGRPRRAAVSSFGISGTNAHVVLEQPPLPTAEPAAQAWPLVLSARSAAALAEQAARLDAHIAGHGAGGVARSLVTTRPLRAHRAVVLTEDGLRDLAARRPSPDAVTGVAVDSGRSVLVFPGQGAQWRGMGRELWAANPVFAARMADCAAALEPHTGWSLRDIVFGVRGAPEFDRVDVVQPVSFAVMVALAAVWESAGFRPDAVLGHSQGEIAAACVAGALSLEDAARVVALRSRIIADELAGRGGMLSVAVAPEEIEPVAGVELAAVNGPRAVVLAGDPDTLTELESRYRASGIRVRRVPVDYASHTTQVEQAADRIAVALMGIVARAPRIPWMSTVDVAWVGGPLEPDYWVRNLRRPVRFAEAVARLAEAGYGLFVESSGHPVLTAAIADSAGRDVVVAGTLRRDDGGPGRITRALAEVFIAGGHVDWTAVLPPSRPVPLPTSVFERRRFWLGDPPEPAAAAPVDTDRTDLVDLVCREAALVLGERDPIPAGRPFRDAGFDSLTAVDLRTRLAHDTGVTLPVTAVFDHPTAAMLAAHLAERLAGGGADEEIAANVANTEPIAVIGMAVRLPGGVRGPAEFWQLLESGADAITGFPADRGWDLDRLRAGASATTGGGFLDGATDFDAGFFGISPREALAMEPQQRIFLEAAWEALEDARIDPASMRGSATGVFVGATPQSYGPDPAVPGPAEGYLLTGTLPAVISGRVAYVLGTEGPAVTVDTACSSSLVALHLAAQSLRAGECATAVAGGVTVLAGPGIFVEFSRQGGLSADGRCRAFGADADGTGWAEGAGVLVLQRLSDATRAGRRVLAVIRGSAVNSDGTSNGLTAPNGSSQRRVIRQALANAGLRPSEVDAVEAHGTGTRLGDPIEAEALLATYGQDRRTPLWLGSVKSNVGHTQAAAGVTGVIKMILALRNGLLPRTLHAERRSELVDWSAGAIELLNEAVPWPVDGHPRRAGISAFGVSGTNAHLVLEEAPASRTAPLPDARLVPLVVSARTARALSAQTARLAEHLTRTGTTPAEIAGPLVTTRTITWEHRAVVLAETVDEAIAGLREPAISGTATTGGLGFVFAGQGAQHAGMGRELYAAFPVFARAFDAACAELDRQLAGYVPHPVRQAVFEGTGLSDTVYAQAALFAVEVATVELLASLGVAPRVVAGHSLGEIGAAHVAGVLSLADAATLVAARGRLMQELPPGGMMTAVPVAEDRARAVLADGVAIAAVNGPEAVVLSGAAEGVAATIRALGVDGRALRVRHAFHSPLLDPMLEPLREVLAGLEFRAPRLPLVSGVTGAVLDAGTVRDPQYWVDQARRTVRFADVVTAMTGDDRRPVSAIVEVGPGGTLTGFARGVAPGVETVAPLRRGRPEVRGLLDGLGRLYVTGHPVRWTELVPPAPTAELPTTVFERRRFWLSAGTGHPVVDTVVETPATGGVVLSGTLSGPVTSGALVELALRAADEAGQPGLAELSVAILPAPGPVRVTVRADDRTLVVHTRAAGGWLEVATGSVAASDAVPALCTGPFDELSVEDTASGYTIHPALLDGIAPGESAYSWQDVRLHAVDATAVRIRRVPCDDGFRLTLTDAADRPVLTAARVRTRPVAPAERPAPVLYRRVHMPSLLVPGTQVSPVGLSTAQDAPWYVLRSESGALLDQVAAVLTAMQRFLADPGRTAARLLILTPPTAQDPVAAAVGGLVRTAITENPGRIVLASTADEGHAPLHAVLDAAVDAEEYELILTDGEVLVPRLGRIDPGQPWRATGTVLVTGGTGALGSLVARHLVTVHGVRKLVLASRRAALRPGGAAERLGAELAAAGADATFVAVDLADRDQVRTLLSGIDDLRAVVHTAGVVDDGVISALDRSRLATVFGPKIEAAVHLDELTRDRALDAFVLFSSVSGVLGSAGQAAYAAANAAMDALAARRGAAGYPAVSVAWGPWEPTGGMTAQLSEVDKRRLVRLGFTPLTADRGLGLLDSAAGSAAPAVVAADFDPAAVRTGSAVLRGPGRPVRRRAAVAEVNTAGPFADVDPVRRLAAVTDLVRREAAAVLGLPSAGIAAARAFRDAGFDSLTAIELRNRLSAATGLPLPATAVFDRPNPDELAAHLIDLATGATGDQMPCRAAVADTEPIAVVGLAVRLPGGVRTPEEYWRLLDDGVDAISEFPRDRGWDVAGLYDPRPGTPGRSVTRHGGFLHDAALFDADFFGISPREALAMDPQQRLLLETSWEALERAGIDPASLRGHELGVFAGASAQPYGVGGPADGYQLTGTASSVLSGRIAYVLGTHGPAVTVDTACSSSLVALHLAVRSLRAGECSTALAAAVTVLSTPDVFVEFSRQRGLAQDGRCKPFAAAADGTAWAEGVGVVVLQRLSDAVAQGREILAVVRGTAVNSDGASNGLTAPNGPAQERVIRQALADAGLRPAEVDAVEAHGTGTRLGDPIEAQALLATYGQDRATPLWLGSVKSNIGHTQAAAGMAGLIKMILALRNGRLPRTLHVDRPTDQVDWTTGAVRLVTEPLTWPEADRPRRAAVSAFGVSGTNAHVVIEQAPVRDPVTGTEQADTEVVPLVLSGRTATALAAQAARLVEHFPDSGLPAVARALVTSRSAREYRAVVLAGDRDGAMAALRDLAAGRSTPDTVTGTARDIGRSVLVFPGQGAQWAGMGRQLLANPVFAARMADCAAALEPVTGWSLLDRLDDLDRVDVVQPVTFAVMVSLAAVWESSGFVPDAVLGHSQGEIAAACVAGALSLADAARVVAVRSRVIAEELAGRGGMLSVALDPAALELPDGVEVAVVNGPGATVLAGDPAALELLESGYRARGVRVRRLPVDYASHSAHVDVVAERIVDDLAGISAAVPVIPWMSTVDVSWVTEPVEPGYWVRNLRRPVRFAAAVAELHRLGHGTFVEAGPHPVLTAAITGTLDDAEPLVCGTLRRDDGGRARLLRSLAELYVGGGRVDWAAVLPQVPQAPVPPTVFEPRHFWRLPVRTGGAGVGSEVVGHPILVAAHEIPDDGGCLLTGRISVTDQPWLADHAVSGALLVPGTALVELALQGGLRTGRPVLDELVVETPLALGATETREVQVVVGALTPDGARPVSVHSRDGGPWTRHAAGRLTAELPLPLDGAECPGEATYLAGPDLYATVAAAGYEYGPMFQGVRWVRRRDDEFFAEVALPDGVDPGNFLLHPALFDALLHPAALRVRDTAELPFAWRGVTVCTPASGVLRVHLTPGPDGIRVHATDRTGATVCAVRGLVSRPVAAAAAEVFVLDTVAFPVHESIPASGDPLTEPWRLLRAEPGDGTDAERARRAVSAVAEALAAALGDDATKLVVQTSDAADPAVAAVQGLVRCAQAEHPGRILLAEGDIPAARTAEALLAAGEGHVVLRDGAARVPRLVRATGGAEPKPWHGTVLVTGGTGTLGALTARHLVREYGVRDLKLVSRRGPAAAGAENLRAELIAEGAAVRVLAADITDPATLRDLLADPPAVVVHAAGALADATVGSIGPDTVETVFRPKADVALLLDELTRGTGTTLVFYSSAAGVLGNPGQGAYAAANAFLDAVARRRAAAGAPVFALAWGLWAEASGLTRGLDAAGTGRMARAGVTGITTEQGLRMFDAALAAGRPVTVPVAVDRAAFDAVVPAIWRELIRPKPAPAGRAVLDRLAATDPDRRLGVLVDLVRREAAVVLSRSGTGGVGPAKAFRDLGFDSLTSVELRNRLTTAIGVRLPVTAVFDHPDATALAHRLHTELFPAPPPDPAPPGHTDEPTAITEMDVEDLIRRALGEQA
ncbi:SDR family NAD(P)-dependent oxidoreductase [Nocardia sp. NPDC052566]|uniref:SDR family NAD(P)-dependent oxidoreductase n=1 Tax=Nocardia sp. NPDC052566 TaxID=3364330 RepID=UPI0037C8C77A